MSNPEKFRRAASPSALLDGLDLAGASYQVSIFSDAEDGEGIGNVRPVYSRECWEGNSCPWFVQQYRLGGGSGQWDEQRDSRDSDTTDPNAIDIISGTIPQTDALKWGPSSATVPFVSLSQ